MYSDLWPEARKVTLANQEFFAESDGVVNANELIRNSYVSGDHITMGDVGIYDLLLHKRDVSYDIREAFRFVEMGGYNFVGFYLPELNIPLTLNPRILGLQLIESFLMKPLSSQQYIGDILKGDMNQNGMFISKQKSSEAKLSLEDNSIYTYGSPVGLRNIIYDIS